MAMLALTWPYSSSSSILVSSTGYVQMLVGLKLPGPGCQVDLGHRTRTTVEGHHATAAERCGSGCLALQQWPASPGWLASGNSSSLLGKAHSLWSGVPRTCSLAWWLQ